MINRDGEMVSPQISKMGAVENLSTTNFKPEDGVGSLIKNDGQTAVFLEVRLSGMPMGRFVKTRFETGWNPEIVKEIKSNGIENLDIKWGY